MHFTHKPTCVSTQDVGLSCSNTVKVKKWACLTGAGVASSQCRYLADDDSQGSETGDGIGDGARSVRMQNRLASADILSLFAMPASFQGIKTSLRMPH